MIDPQILVRIKELSLVARMVVTGFTAGLHHSVRRGSGLEFSQYRSYEPGDDLRRLDWKMFSRSDRFFIREAETETSLRIQFVLDGSNSMNHEEAGITKIAYARLLLAALGYLASLQGDEISLHVLQQEHLQEVLPQTNNTNLKRFWHALEKIKPAGAFALAKVRQSLLRQTKKKTITIFITDMYEQESEITGLLASLRGQHQEVLLLHLIAGNEKDLAYEGTFTFEDLETGAQVQLDATRNRKAYQEQYQTWLEALGQNLRQKGIDYQRLLIHEPVDTALRTFLKTRERYY